MAVKTELTDEDLDHFRENGYLVLPQAFNADEVARMQHEADRILELIINSFPGQRAKKRATRYSADIYRADGAQDPAH